jgi:PBP1b-binding outer membrane lipoprotein LpoB
MKKRISIIILSAAFLAGCSNPMESAAPRISQVEHSTADTERTTVPVTRNYEAVTSEKEARFHKTMLAVAKSTKQDPHYHRMALNTAEEKKWFKDLMYRLWDRQITRKEFIAQGTAKYPDHKYEFTYIANAYQNY